MLQLSSARPYFATGNWKYASGATTRRSQIIDRMTPAPIVGPLIAPITGTGAWSIARFSAMALSGSSSATPAASVRSAPELNTWPWPVSTMARTSSARLSRRLAQAVDELAVQRVAALGALHLQGHHVAVAGHTNHAATLYSLCL